jgi:hypothetical protein
VAAPVERLPEWAVVGENRHSNGPHVGDCYRRLSFLHASLEVPAQFSAVDYDVPPPLPDENIYFQRPVIFLGDPTYDFLPPPPIPEAFLPPPPPDFIGLAAPELPAEPFVLPTPIYTPVPIWVRPPRFVEPPPANNVIFANLHNKVAVDRRTRSYTVTDHGGNTRTFQAPRTFQDREQRREQRDGGRHAGARRQLAASDANVGPSLPPSVSQSGAMTNGRRVDRAQRNQSSPLPLAGATEPRLPGAQSRAANRQLPVTRYGEPLPKPVPSVPGTATGTTRAQGLWGGRPQAPAPGTPRAAQLPPAQSSARAGQPHAKPALPPATTARPQGPAQPAQALPKGPPPPPLAQPAPTNRQSAEQAGAARAQEQAAQQRAQQQQAAQQRAQQQQAAQQRAQQQQAAQQRAQQQQAAQQRAQQQQAAQQRAQQQQAAQQRAQQQQAAQQRAQQQQAAQQRAQQQQAAQQRAQQQAAAARAQAAARASPAISGARAQHGPPQRR